MANSQKLKFRFGVDSHSVDLSVLVETLISTSEIIDYIHGYYKYDNNINIKIGAPVKGSLEIDLELIHAGFKTIRTIFTNDNISIISTILQNFIDLYKLYKFLINQPKEEVKKTENSNNTITLTNSNNNTITINTYVVNMYESGRIKPKIDRTLNAVSEDTDINEFTIETPDPEQKFSFSREDIEMAINAEETIELGEQIVTRKAELILIRVSFDPRMKWDFWYSNQKISAKLNDKEFGESIDKRIESFHKGDTLTVELRIKQVYDNELKIYKDTSYQINKVYKHNKVGTQTNLLE
ncbi:MAG: hypothetical protein L6Q47_11120 [Ignavibacteriaceae bacterium]|nr:hypothetical protein [Ignavibacteriaceae bacterium]